MLSLIEILLTFVGVMLILALAAQSLQEFIKIVFAIKGYTRVEALRGLIVEASVATEQASDVGQEIYESVVKRLAALGQNGVRAGKVRLDRLTPDQLKELITTTPVADIAPLNALEIEKARDCLDNVAVQAEKWFALAMNPVLDRYKRRMRGWALLSAGIVVLALNADAIKIFQQARTDGEFRRRVLASVASLDSLERIARGLESGATSTIPSVSPTGPVQASDTVGQPADTATQPSQESGQSEDTTTQRPAMARLDSVTAVRDSIQVLVLRLAAAEDGFLVGVVGHREPTKPEWWVGILISLLLVSLGAPFWHDVLTSLFGLKNRINAQAEVARTEAAAGSAALARRQSVEEKNQ